MKGNLAVSGSTLHQTDSFEALTKPEPKTSPSLSVTDAAMPSPAVANSTAITELVQLTIDGKAELIQQILPQPVQGAVEQTSSDEKAPLHDFKPGMSG